MNEFTASQIAEYLQGVVEGDEDAMVTTVSKIEEGKEGSLSFLANEKYIPYLYTTQATIVLVNNSFIPEKEVSTTMIKVEDAYASFARLLDLYNQFKDQKEGIHSTAIVSESASIGVGVYIGEYVVIGDNVKIGDRVKIYSNTYIGADSSLGEDTKIHSGVNLYTETKIGKRCNIHSGCVIGGDGFGFAPQGDGHFEKVAQIGNVIIENDVEVGANTTIDRATLGSTIIRKGVKLDNLIQIAHNVDIGENTVIAAQAGISGSVKIGKNCMLGGQVGVAGHIVIPDGTRLQAQSGLGKNIKKKGLALQGSPAFDYGQYNRSWVIFKNLEKMEKRLRELERKLNS